MNEHVESTITNITLRRMFDDVHTVLQSESGYGLDAQTREDAWRQVQLYWSKLQQAVAGRVTETEVPLTLMNNMSPGNRPFTIHGVVDVVQEQDQITLYDIKSHDYLRLHENIESYGPQLQVYAYIWSELRGQQVDQTCIINTDPPPAVKGIVDVHNMTDAEREAYEQWQPVIPITNFSAERVQETIRQFGHVVDAIESGLFNPPTIDDLQKKQTRLPVPLMCAKCDVRFSCSSYRALVYQSPGYQSKVMRFYDMSDTISEIRDQSYDEQLHDNDMVTEEIEAFMDDAAANLAHDDEDFPF
jgi:hypothetical protein